MTTKTAVIRWLPPERGGRNAPPDGAYRTVVRFEDDERWPEESWSLVVRPIRFINAARSAMLAGIEFLAPEAPAQLLATGARFELREGPHIVAKGVILPNEIDVPERIDSFALSLLGS